MPVEKKLAEVPEGRCSPPTFLDAHGDVLLAKGTALTRAHLQLLQRRAVAAVSLLAPGEPPPGPGGLDPAQVTASLGRQERVFSKVRGGPRMEALYQAARATWPAGTCRPHDLPG